MARNLTHSICNICTAHCPVQVETENNKCLFVQGNPYAAGIKGALCARGASAVSRLQDDQRPQFPMLRKGSRGEGKWQKISWEEAFDYTVEKLRQIQAQFGGRSIVWSDGDTDQNDLHQAFVHALGSPNYFTAASAVGSNLEQAARSLFGFGRDDLVLDMKNSRHVVLQTRNLMESVDIREVNNLLDGLDAGAKLTVIDSRASVAASKADRFLLIRPGTDYALNLAILNELLKKGLYNAAFAEARIKDINGLKTFINPYTPAFAQAETGIAADDIIALASELAKAAPYVIWHPGRMTARYRDSFQVCRTAYMINALLGSIGSRGGLPLAVRPEDLDRQGLKSMLDLVPQVGEKRADGVGWKYPQFDPHVNLLHLAFQAMQTSEPYPLKAFIACGFDPLALYPDPAAIKKSLDRLDFLISMPYAWSNIAWYADLVLPLSSYIEADDLIRQVNGLNPTFYLPRKSCPPRFDTRADWQIISGLAQRMGIIHLVFDSIQKIWTYQLQGTGVSIEDFMATGFVEFSKKPVYKPSAELIFKTASQKIEPGDLVSYIPKAKPDDGTFRLTLGGSAVQAPAHTRCNTLLHSQMPRNLLWINQSVAEKMGIKNSETVAVVNSRNEKVGCARVFVIEFIHPEAVYMLHGWGPRLSLDLQVSDAGVPDTLLMPGGLDIWDPAGGGVALQEHLVRLEKII